MKKKLSLTFLLLVFLLPNQGETMEDQLKEKMVHSKKRKQSAAESPQVKRTEPLATSSKFAEEAEVELRAGKGTKASGGGQGGHYWNIFYNNTRAGKVFINLIDQAPLGKHPSLQIFLNKVSQGKHIGRIAYQKACELSQYDTLYAYMSKRNFPSLRAAAAAGFIQILQEKTRQVIMQWTRKKKVSQ